MAVAGPIVYASWRVPEPLQAILQEAGRPVPNPVLGGLLLDTGAAKTCISEKAADDLGLKPTRLAKTYGAGGEYELSVVNARLGFRVSSARSEHEVSFETEAQVIPLLEAGGRQMGLKSGDNEIRLIGLLGRDLLRHAQVSYDGINGRFEISFDLGSLSASRSQAVHIQASP
jgi:hypothetical protein